MPVADKPQAYAALVVPTNYQAILSEGGSQVTKDVLKKWVDENGPGGYFLREEEDPLDCHLFTSDQFHQLYMFEKGDVDTMFRQVRKQ